MTDTFDALVEQLGDRPFRWEAVQRLMQAGPDATPALRRGLSHAYASVRVGCCKVLDHHLDNDAVPDLLANVSHPNRKVRAWALHALACDRCKEGDCRPGAADVVPLMLDRLTNDPSARVRRMALLLGLQYLDEAPVVRALGRAALEDPHERTRRLARVLCEQVVKRDPSQIVAAFA